MPTKTGYWVRVENGKVLQIWDREPSNEQRAKESGWCEAVETHPNLRADREVFTTYEVNIDVSPVEILWSKRELDVFERKDLLISAAKQAFYRVVQSETAKETDQYPETQYDAAVVDAARIVFKARMDQINAATTHEEIDVLAGV